MRHRTMIAEAARASHTRNQLRGHWHDGVASSSNRVTHQMPERFPGRGDEECPFAHSVGAFEALYQEGNVAWDISRPEDAFARLAESDALRGRVLDVGCGTGEHALQATGLGLEVRGIDAAPMAIELTKEMAGAHWLTVDFRTEYPRFRRPSVSSTTQSRTAGCSTCSTTTIGLAVCAACGRH